MKSRLAPTARTLRKRMTNAESKLWFYLRNKGIGYKFRRQLPIDEFIVDFACLKKRLIIEVDGEQHLESREDKARDKYLESQGFKVLRFWNDDVLTNIEAVVERIVEELSHPHLDPPPSRGRR